MDGLEEPAAVAFTVQVLDWSDCERLTARFLAAGSSAIADDELLQLLLSFDVPEPQVKTLTRELLATYGSLGAVFAAERTRLEEVEQIKPSTIVLLKAVYIAAQRMLHERLRARPVIGSWQTLLDYCQTAMAYEAIEQVRVLFLDRKNALIKDEIQQRGTVDHTPLYPREIVRRALELRASAVILVHNHPSGDPTPSSADVEMTRRVIAALATVDIVVHDHVIVGQGRHVSFRSLGLL